MNLGERTLDDLTTAANASNEDARLEEVASVMEHASYATVPSSASSELRELADAMIMAMVDTPEVVVTMSTGDDKTVDLSVSVAQGEVGLVIGKEGRNARALRTILGAAAARLKIRVTLNIEEAK